MAPSSIFSKAVTQQDNAPGKNIPADYPDMPSQQDLHTLYQETLEPYFTRALAQIKILDCMLQDLAFNLANNSSIATKSRGQAVIKIRAMREMLSGLKETSFVLLNEQLINSFIYIIRTTINQLIVGLQRGIDSLEAVDLNNLQLPTKKELTIEDLEKELAQNDSLIKNLETLSNNIGLHWYNKVYRKFKHIVVEPAKAAALPAFITASLGASAICAWYYFGGENPKWLREKIGWPQDSDFAEQQGQIKLVKKLNERVGNILHELDENFIDKNLLQKIENKYIVKEATIPTKPIGTFGLIEQKLYRLNQGRYAIGAALLSAGQVSAQYLFPRLGTAIANKIKAADNFLMGGAYKNRAVDDYTYKSDVTFDSIIGQEDAKQYGLELCQYLKDPELLDRTKIAPSTGILLFGDTRTGKSFYISALHGEIQKALGKEGAAFKVWKVSFQDLLKYGIQEIMDTARHDAPMIVVIEEIDLLGLQRVNNAERLASFMTAMSSCLQENTLDKAVIIIGTTNKLENLEPALRETGRFGKHIYFSYPKFNERKLFIERELVKTACNLKQFDIDKLARDTEGCSFEKLGLFIKRTFLRAKLYNETVSQATLEQSIDENIRGISVSGVTLDQEQKQLVAAHLAGHTVASILLDPHQKISKVTLRDVASKIEEELAVMSLLHKDDKEQKQAAIEHGKIFANHDHDMPGIETRQEKLKQCKICLAGHVAETLLLGSCGYGYHAHDKQVALNIAKTITCGDVDLTSLSDKIRDQYYDSTFELLNSCEQEVTKLLEDHRTELTAVMNALMDKLTIDAHELRRLICGEQSIVEQLDANNLLSNLLKDQSGLELDVSEHMTSKPVDVTASMDVTSTAVQAA